MALFVPHSTTIREAGDRWRHAAAAVGRDIQTGKTSVLDRHHQTIDDLAPPGATPTIDPLPRRFADFVTLGDALDYAATGRRGMNFHDARGTLVQAYPYAQLREDALANAGRFMALESGAAAQQCSEGSPNP